MDNFFTTALEKARSLSLSRTALVLDASNIMASTHRTTTTAADTPELAPSSPPSQPPPSPPPSQLPSPSTSQQQWLSIVAAELSLELARVDVQLAALAAHQLNIGELALKPNRICADDEEPLHAYGQLLCAGLDPADPEPRIDDPGSWRGAPTHRRAYQSWHAREQRRKKRPAPAAALDPAPTASRRQSAASTVTASAATASAAATPPPPAAAPTPPPPTATATVSRDGAGSASIISPSGTVSVTRDASGSITATATTIASPAPPSAKALGKQPVTAPPDQPPISTTTKRPTIAADLLAINAKRETAARPPCPADGPRMAAFEARFPHEPSPDQQRAFADVARDMIESVRPMQRLVCGDVGFGKTEVAMRAIYRAVCAGRQAALLAPREPLAMQHYHSLLARMPDVRVELLVSGRKERDKAATKRAASEGTVEVLVGTSAVLAVGVTFANLGLVVVDEEQLFGVRQKEGLKSVSADLLLLSATPIPRTSALHALTEGFRTLSNLTTPPPDRLAVRTVVCERDDAQVLHAVQAELVRGGQIFYVVPWIEMVQGEVDLLCHHLPNVRIVMAHSDLSDLSLRIAAFQCGEVDVLVATTVVECGISIARANTIIVQEAVRADGHSNAVHPHPPSHLTANVCLTAIVCEIDLSEAAFVGPLDAPPAARPCRTQFGSGARIPHAPARTGQQGAPTSARDAGGERIGRRLCHLAS